jgi:hydrogenase-4 component H
MFSKFKEAMVGLKTGRVTLPYPAQARPVAENFRGRPIFDAPSASVAPVAPTIVPAREILVWMSARRSASCNISAAGAPTAGVAPMLCPEKAITMSLEFETATNSIGDIQQRLDLFMSTCQRCGRCFKEPFAAGKTEAQGLPL